MKIIAHRRNTIEQLESTPRQYGVEVDIRSWQDQLIIHHDPFIQGECFEEWLTHYRHQTLILNVKEEGLEERLTALMQNYHIKDFFFLDQSFPFLIKSVRANQPHCAIRISEFESIETALTLSNQINWAWIDCFTQFPLQHDNAQQLKNAGFKLCLVSPELQGRSAEIEIPQLRRFLYDQKIYADAVCTKQPNLWEKSL